MATRWGAVIAVCAGIASAALAQEGSVVQQPASSGHEGFFRPARDPALTRFPTPDEAPAASRAVQQPAPTDEQALAAFAELAKLESRVARLGVTMAPGAPEGAEELLRSVGGHDPAENETEKQGSV